MKDGSTTDHAEIKEECRMKKNEDEDPNFYYFYFNIEHCRETKADGEVVEPGREVEEGKYFHPKTLEILDSRDDAGDDAANAIPILRDSIAYTYYIHHQRVINGVAIMGMPPIPITCVLPKDNARESSYEVIPEKVEPEDSEPVLLDTKFFKLEFKSAKKGKKCEKECKYDMGDLVTLKLTGQAHGSVLKDLNEIFRFALKECEVYAGEFAEDSKPMGKIIDNYCKTTEFNHIVFKDDLNFRNDELNTFQSFKFIMFRYPDHSSRIDIKCKVSIFSRLIEEDLLPGPCDLHNGAKEGERKRRSIFESFFRVDDDISEHNEQELEITGGFKLV